MRRALAVVTACLGCGVPATTPRATTPPHAVSSSAADDDGAGSTAAGADELTPTRVESHLEGATAVFRVRYAFHEVRGGAKSFASLDLPDLGVVVAAEAFVDGARHTLAMEDARTSNAALDQLLMNDAGSDPARVVIVRSSRNQVEVALAVPGPSSVALELEIAAPTCLAGDDRYAAIPEAWKTVAPTSPAGSCDPGLGTQAVWQRFSTTELHDTRDRVSVLGGRLVAAGTHVAKLELALPAQLADVPKDLATAIVLDASRSITAKQLAAQQAIVHAYLERVPTSRVQVIAVSRTARPLLPGWLVASSAMARVDRELANLRLANGTNLDAGIAAAEQWLAQLPEGSSSNGFSSHRIVVLHDGRMPSRFDSAPPKARSLTHVIELTDQDIGLVRDDDVSLATTAIATTGLSLRGGATKLDVAILTRPLTLDSLAFAAPGWTALERTTSACGDTLDAGSSCQWWGKGTVASPPVVVTGRLWNRKIERVVSLDARRGLAMARELSATAAGVETPAFDPFVQGAIDRAARAVTPTTSLVARWGGTAGYGRVEMSTESSSVDDFSTVGSHLIGSRAVDSVRAVHAMDLRPLLAPVVASCKGNDRRASITLETTGNEIVDVAVVVTPGDTAIHDCIVEALWDLELHVTDGLFRTSRHAVVEAAKR